MHLENAALSGAGADSRAVPSPSDAALVHAPVAASSIRRSSASDETTAEQSSGDGWRLRWQLDLHPDSVAFPPDYARLKRGLLVVANPDDIARRRVEGLVVRARPTVQTRPNHQVWADVVWVVFSHAEPVWCLWPANPSSSSRRRIGAASSPPGPARRGTRGSGRAGRPMSI